MTTPRADIGAEAVKDAGDVPEEKLAAGVLRTALDDLLEPQRCCGDGNPIDVLREARQFCFSDKPESKRWREFWCEAAGVDQHYFQRLAAQRCAAYR